MKWGFNFRIWSKSIWHVLILSSARTIKWRGSTQGQWGPRISETHLNRLSKSEWRRTMMNENSLSMCKQTLGRWQAQVDVVENMWISVASLWKCHGDGDRILTNGLMEDQKSALPRAAQVIISKSLIKRMHLTQYLVKVESMPAGREESHATVLEHLRLSLSAQPLKPWRTPKLTRMKKRIEWCQREASLSGDKSSQMSLPCFTPTKPRMMGTKQRHRTRC